MSTIESGGTVYVKRNGTQVSAEGGIKLSLGGGVKTPKVGSDGRVLGYTTKYMAPKASMELSDDGSLSLKEIQSADGDTVTLELGNGKTYVFESIFTTNEIELDAEGGKIAWNISALSATEQTAT